jgi:hypothetical protein
MFLYRPSFSLDVHQLDAQPGSALRFDVGEKGEDESIHVRPILLNPVPTSHRPEATGKAKETEEEDDRSAGCLRKRIALAFDVGRRVCNMKPELRPILSLHGHLPPVLCFAVETPEVGRCLASDHNSLRGHLR